MARLSQIGMLQVLLELALMVKLPGDKTASETIKVITCQLSTVGVENEISRT